MTPFENAASAKSHPWAAHQLRSSDRATIRRRLRRVRRDLEAKSEETLRNDPVIREAIAFLELCGFRVTFSR